MDSIRKKNRNETKESWKWQRFFDRMEIVRMRLNHCHSICMEETVGRWSISRASLLAIAIGTPMYRKTFRMETRQKSSNAKWKDSWKLIGQRANRKRTTTIKTASTGAVQFLKVIFTYFRLSYSVYGVFVYFTLFFVGFSIFVTLPCFFPPFLVVFSLISRCFFLHLFGFFSFRAVFLLFHWIQSHMRFSRSCSHVSTTTQRMRNTTVGRNYRWQPKRIVVHWN